MKPQDDTLATDGRYETNGHEICLHVILKSLKLDAHEEKRGVRGEKPLQLLKAAARDVTGICRWKTEDVMMAWFKAIAKKRILRYDTKELHQLTTLQSHDC